MTSKQRLHVHLAVYSAALAKLDTCRIKCPGAGGDVDAMNLRFLIKNEDTKTSAANQAAHTLEWLSRAVQVDATNEIEALRALEHF